MSNTHRHHTQNERNIKLNHDSLRTLERVEENLKDGGHSAAKLLQDIEHTANSIEERIGVDSSGTPLSLTALLRNQKDVIDNKLGVIAGFLDKDNSQFHLKHHTTSNLVGNTSADGTGSHNHAHVDSNGNLRVSSVSSQNILPADALNSGTQNDPANSLAVGLRARTNVGQASTEQFLLCDSDGHLQVDIVSGGGGGGGGDASAANQTTMIGHLVHNGVGVAEQAKNIEDTLNSVETQVIDGGKGVATHVNEVKGHLIHNSVSVAEQAKNIEDTLNSIESLSQDGGKSVSTHVNEVKGHLIHNTDSVAKLAKDIEDTANSIETLLGGTAVVNKKALYTIQYANSGGDDGHGHVNIADAATQTHNITIDQTRELKGINFIVSGSVAMAGGATITYKGSFNNSSFITIETKTFTSGMDFDAGGAGNTHALIYIHFIELKYLIIVELPDLLN